MSISNSIRALLKLCGKRQSDLVGALEMKSIQSLNNKFYNERWSAADLVAVADFCGCRLAFVLPDGVVLPISAADPAGAGAVQASPALRGMLASDLGGVSPPTSEAAKNASV